MTHNLRYILNCMWATLVLHVSYQAAFVTPSPGWYLLCAVMAMVPVAGLIFINGSKSRMLAEGAFMSGAMSCFPALYMSLIIIKLMGLMGVEATTWWGASLHSGVTAGVVEELLKFLFLILIIKVASCWKNGFVLNRGVIYKMALFVGVGFATLENFLYFQAFTITEIGHDGHVSIANEESAKYAWPMLRGRLTKWCTHPALLLITSNALVKSQNPTKARIPLLIVVPMMLHALNNALCVNSQAGRVNPSIMNVYGLISSLSALLYVCYCCRIVRKEVPIAATEPTGDKGSSTPTSKCSSIASIV